MYTSEDIKYMKTALSLAVKGGYYVRPNPMVGAVIVKNKRIIGSGYHRKFGKPHAEIYALKQAGNKAKGSTMYVTLEPCGHYGKTPPCTEAIIKYGIKKVIIAMKDPNKRGPGKGIRTLRKHKIIIQLGLLKQEAELLNKVYIKNITRNEPYVILKMAVTFDGKIASHTGMSQWISCDESRRLVHLWRSESEAVMVGSNTVKKDDPMLTSHGFGRDPTKIIIDPQSQTHKNSKLFKSKSKTEIVSKNTVPYKDMFKGTILNLKKLLKYLYKRSVYQLIIEGGGNLNASAFTYKIIDEVRFFIAPKIIGGANAITSVEGKGIDNIANAIKIKNWSYETVGSDILIKGYIN